MRRVASIEPAIELSQRLIVSGSDANETQIKLVWYYNNILGIATR